MKDEVKSYIPFPISIVINFMKISIDGMMGIVLVVLSFIQLFITVADDESTSGAYLIDVGVRVLWFQLSGKFTIWKDPL